MLLLWAMDTMRLHSENSASMRFLINVISGCSWPASAFAWSAATASACHTRGNLFNFSMGKQMRRKVRLKFHEVLDCLGARDVLMYRCIYGIWWNFLCLGTSLKARGLWFLPSFDMLFGHVDQMYSVVNVLCQKVVNFAAWNCFRLFRVRFRFWWFLFMLYESIWNKNIQDLVTMCQTSAARNMSATAHSALSRWKLNLSDGAPYWSARLRRPTASQIAIKSLLILYSIARN